MSWANSIKKNISTPASVGEKRTAGIYSEQDKFRNSVYSEADKLPRYSGVDHNGKELTGKEGSLFSNGELNAWDKKDAFTQLQFANKQAPRVRGAAMRKAVELDPQEREELLRLAYSNNKEDRLRFAQAPISIVYDRLDYIGFTDDVFQKMTLGQGAVPYVEKDVNVPAVVVAEDAKTIKTAITGDRVYFDEFRLTSLVTVDLGEIAQRAYSIIDRIVEKVPRQIALKEDRITVRSLHSASSVQNEPISFTTLDKTTMDQFSREIERHRLDADKFIMNRVDYSDIRVNMRSDEFDPITSRDMFVSGYMGKYYGYDIYVTAGIDEGSVINEVIPPGHVFCVGGPRYVGYQGVRIPLDVYPADQMVNGEPSLGFFYYKQEGIIVSNPRAVAFGLKDTATLAPWI